MIELAWSLIKPLLPFIAAALLLSGAWFHGYGKGKEQLIEYRAVIEAQAEIAKTNADHAEQTLIESARAIDAQADAHKQALDALTLDNRKLLDSRLRAKPSCRSVPTDTTSTGFGVGTDSREWVVSEAVANRLIERHAIADQVTETASACQQYIKSIEETINGTHSNDH